MDLAYDAGMIEPVSEASQVAPGDRSLADQTWTRLLELFFEVARRHLDRTVATLDLSHTKAHALRCIEPGRPLAMGELAEELKCDPSNITGVVDRLEARRLVERRSAPNDRRVKTLVLTEEGAELRGRLVAALGRAPSAVASLSPQDLRQLGEIVQRILDNRERPSS